MYLDVAAVELSAIGSTHICGHLWDMYMLEAG